MTEALSTKEKFRWAICKDGIAQGIDNVFRVGAMLREVKDDRLYRAEFSSFEAYCETVNGLSKAHAYRLIEAANTKDSVSPMGDALQGERAARELAKVPEPERKKVLKAAVKAGGATAKNITAAAAAKSASIDAEIIYRDHTPNGGTKIPKPAIPFWERRDEVQPWLTQISAIKCAIEKALKEGDALFAWIGNPAIDFLGSAYAAISNAKLYAVCTECEGWFDKGNGCQTCHNTGLISKHQFDVCSRQEIKNMREKSKTLHL